MAHDVGLVAIREPDSQCVCCSSRGCHLTGFSYETAVHRVSGEVLCLMDAESLKEIGIETIGQRLAILKAVYQLKVAQQIPIDSDHYVPPCEQPVSPSHIWTDPAIAEVDERQEHLNADRLYDILKEQGASYCPAKHP